MRNPPFAPLGSPITPSQLITLNSPNPTPRRVRAVLSAAPAPPRAAIHPFGKMTSSLTPSYAFPYDSDRTTQRLGAFVTRGNRICLLWECEAPAERIFQVILARREPRTPKMSRGPRNMRLPCRVTSAIARVRNSWGRSGKLRLCAAACSRLQLFCRCRCLW
jgi:hypothetical protein